MDNDSPEPHEELNDLLSDDAPQETETPTPETESAEENSEGAEGDAGAAPRGTPASDPEEKPKPSADDRIAALEKENAGFRQAMEAERRKRQEAEAGAARTAPELPDPVEDPEGYRAAVLEEVRRESATQALAASVNRAQVADPEKWSAAEAAFLGAAEGNPALRIPTAHPDPAQWVLDWHAQTTALADIGDPVKFKDAVRAELAKEFDAKMAEKDAEIARLQGLAGLPQPMGQTPSKGSPTTGEAAPAEESLDDVLGNGS